MYAILRNEEWTEGSEMESNCANSYLDECRQVFQSFTIEDARVSSRILSHDVHLALQCMGFDNPANVVARLHKCADIFWVDLEPILKEREASLM